MKTIKRFFSSILVFLIIGCLFRVSGTESFLETLVWQSDEKTKCLSMVSPISQNYNCKKCGLDHIYGQCTLELIFNKNGTLRSDAPLEFWGKKLTHKADKLYEQSIKPDPDKEPLAEQEDPVVQYVLGIASYCSRDYGSALNYFKQSAAKNHIDALFMLAILYQYGIGVPQDFETAIEHHTQAAAQNHTFAKDNLKAIKNIKRYRNSYTFW